ncbi:hypothetical protein BSQ35_02000 [Serratia liquefaciens]|nr:hypothetical protein BSQ35_02000 [Serratia liquefaciens]
MSKLLGIHSAAAYKQLELFGVFEFILKIIFSVCPEPKKNPRKKSSEGSLLHSARHWKIKKPSSSTHRLKD